MKNPIGIVLAAMGIAAALNGGLGSYGFGRAMPSKSYGIPGGDGRRASPAHIQEWFKQRAAAKRLRRAL